MSDLTYDPVSDKEPIHETAWMTKNQRVDNPEIIRVKPISTDLQKSIKLFLPVFCYNYRSLSYPVIIRGASSSSRRK